MDAKSSKHFTIHMKPMTVALIAVHDILI